MVLYCVGKNFAGYFANSSANIFLAMEFFQKFFWVFFEIESRFELVFELR